MKIKVIYIILVVFCFVHYGYAQEDNYIKIIFNYTKTKSHIKDGGSDVFNYKDQLYVISVAKLEVGTKTEIICQKVGAAKAKKEMLAFVNGSDITSYTEMVVVEDQIKSSKNEIANVREEYVEYIKESVIGNINKCIPLGGWYSKDKSMYYYAMYRLIE